MITEAKNLTHVDSQYCGFAKFRRWRLAADKLWATPFISLGSDQAQDLQREPGLPQAEYPACDDAGTSSKRPSHCAPGSSPQTELCEAMCMSMSPFAPETPTELQPLTGKCEKVFGSADTDIFF